MGKVGGAVRDTDYVGGIGCSDSVVDSGMGVGVGWAEYYDTWSG